MFDRPRLVSAHARGRALVNNELVSIEVIAGVLVVRPKREMTTERMIGSLEVVASDPRLEKGAPTVWDLSGAHVGNMTSASLKPVVQFVKERAESRGRASVAIIAADPAMYGMMRVYEQLVSDFLDVTLFTSMEDAFAWLADRKMIPGES